jgi:hypothetical protein
MPRKLRRKPHDRLFKEAFGEIPRARAELLAVLPPGLRAELDLDRLALVEGSFVDENLRESASDLLFTARLAGGESLVYLLFEHKSTVDPLVSFQLLRYMVKIWEEYRGKHPRATVLPPIVPVVVHHSETGWTRATSFQAVFGPRVRDIPELRRLLPDFEFLLDDVSRSSDADLRARQLDPFGALVLWAFRDARGTGRLIQSMGAWQDELRQVATSPGGERALRLLFSYIVTVSEEPSADAFGEAVRAAAPEAEEIVMTTIAEQFREQGRQQMRGQARRLLLRQLGVRFGSLDADTVERVERGTDQELDLWAERVLTAASLAGVFEG